jgi:AraC-like DNA-binding protein
MKRIPIRKLGTADQAGSSAGSFKIRKLQDILAGSSLLQELHRHDFFFVLLIESGSGSHEIDFTPYPVRDHSVFFLRPGQVHQLALNVGCTGYLVEFNNEFYRPAGQEASRRLRKASNINYCQLEVNRFNKLQSTLNNLFQEYAGREEGYLEIIKANLEIFFIQLVRQSPATSISVTAGVSPYAQERLEEFLDLLEKQITSCKQVAQYATLMSLSAYQLNEITKASVGKTPSQLINEQVILEAKRYLLATPNQVKDIADHLGYEDVSYFVRFFKKQTGYSPESFRHHF